MAEDREKEDGLTDAMRKEVQEMIDGAGLTASMRSELAAIIERALDKMWRDISSNV
jgi:hypothetical protein